MSEPRDLPAPSAQMMQTAHDDLPMPRKLRAPVPIKPPADPDDEPMECEICGSVMRKGDSFSFILGWGTTGPIPVGAFACNGGHYGTGQHFCCSRACAIDAARACIDEHLTPEHEARRVAVVQRSYNPQDQAAWAAHEPRYAPHPDHLPTDVPPH